MGRDAVTKTSATTTGGGELHRIYWHQWISGGGGGGGEGSGSSSSSNRIIAGFFDSQSNNGGGGGGNNDAKAGGQRGRRELITCSAAVRISPAALARDVTQLLRKTLRLPGDGGVGIDDGGGGVGNRPASRRSKEEHDCLVLVGTLFSLPRGYVHYEHEQDEWRQYRYNQQQQQQQQQHQPRSDHVSKTTTTTSSSTPAAGTAQASSAQQAGAPPTGAQHYPARSADPFHVLRTLSPTDSPLRVKRDMIDHLRSLEERAPVTGRNIIPPKLQWFFVPAAKTTDAGNPIPNCIELDGYCTSTEDEEESTGRHEDDDENDYDEDDGDPGERDCFGDDDGRDDGLERELVERFPWLAEESSKSAKDEHEETAQLPADTEERDKVLQKRVRREKRRMLQLSDVHSAPQYQTISGYLLKRSHSDPYVWRRVHCVLSEDYLWFVSRVYEKSSTASATRNGGDADGKVVRGGSSAANDNSNGRKNTPPVRYRYARHGRIKLTRALLLEPSADYAPLYRTPLAFELVSASGASHIFRASSKDLQRKWIQSISDRILQSYENSLLEHAELIIADECMARNRRLSSVVLGPLWDTCRERDLAPPHEPHGGRTLASLPHVGPVLRWGMEVARYRECCRYVQSILPAKSPVVVTMSSPRRSQSGSSLSHLEDKPPPPPPPPQEELDPVAADMIRASWDRASALLTRATQIVLTVQRERKPSHSVETLCRHIDYVITGRLRPLSEPVLVGSPASGSASTVAGSSPSHPPPPSPSTAGASSTTPRSSTMSSQKHPHAVINGSASSSSVAADHRDPPPVDLFDPLLAELRSLAAVADSHAAAAAARGS